MTTMKVEFRSRHGVLLDHQIVDAVDKQHAEELARERSLVGDRDDVLVTVTFPAVLVAA